MWWCAFSCLGSDLEEQVLAQGFSTGLLPALVLLSRALVRFASAFFGKGTIGTLTHFCTWTGPAVTMLTGVIGQAGMTTIIPHDDAAARMSPQGGASATGLTRGHAMMRTAIMARCASRTRHIKDAHDDCYQLMGGCSS